MDKSVVSVVKTGQTPDEAQVRAAVRRAVELAGGLPVQPGQRVLVKPNLVRPNSDVRSGMTTSVEVCKAVADLVREAGAQAIIAESSSVGNDTEAAFQQAGYLPLREQGYGVIDLKATPVVRREIPNGRAFDGLSVFALAAEVDAVISVPVMKTHDGLEVTLALKNLKGLIPDKSKRQLHRRGVVQGCLDVACLVKPVFAVMDAIYCQEGYGPVHGRPIEMDLVLAGRDLVAVDSVASHVMGFTLEELEMLKAAEERGMGHAKLSDIEVIGERIEDVRRRFLRSSEDAQTQADDLRFLCTEGTCTGCRNAVGSAVFDMKSAGWVSYLKDVTIITGPDAVIPDGTDTDKLVAVGVCVPPALRGGRYARGCPPSNIWITASIMGKDYVPSNTEHLDGKLDR